MRATQPGAESSDPLDIGLQLAFASHEASERAPAVSSFTVLRARAGITSSVVLPEPPGEVPARDTGPRGVNGSGQQIGSYRILEEIARGGLGVVLRARDLELGRETALKMLLEVRQDEPQMIRRFIEEAQIAAQLQHPGIVPIYEFGLYQDRTPYFTMKLINGRTLQALLAERRDPSEDRRRFLRVFEQVCQAMAYAHSRGVLHRDLKPANIMVGRFGEVQVMDWGLSKVLRGGMEPPPMQAEEGGADPGALRTLRGGQGSSQTRYGQVMGTPAYMAPEQARGAASEVDERADVFSLGAILCEILTGEPPFPGDTESGVREMASGGRLGEAFSRLEASTADQELLAIARRCLSPSPEGRPGDAGHLSREIGAYLGSVEERARALEIKVAQAQTRAEAERRVRKLSLTLAATIVLALLLGGLGYLAVERDRRERSSLATQAVDRTLEEARVLWDQGRSAPEGDLSRWGQALAAARKAEDLARTGPVGPEAMARVQQLLAGLAREEAEAREKAARREAERRMSERLEEIRMRPADEADFDSNAKKVDEEYAQAFREFGIDVEALPREEAVRRIRASPLSEELAHGLDQWSRSRRTVSTEDRSLFQLARDADPDPMRTLIRQAAEEGSVERLQEISRRPELRKQPLATLELLAVSLFAEGDSEGGIFVARFAQVEHPGDFWINLYLGWWYSTLKPPQLEESVRFLSNSVAVNPRSPGARLGLGRAFLRRKDIAEAAVQFRAALSLNPRSPDALKSLATALDMGGESDAALSMIRELLRSSPEDPQAHALLRSMLVRRKGPGGAIAELREEIRSGPGSAGVHLDLAILLSEKGDLLGSAAALEEAIRFDPRYPDLYNCLGAIYSQRGEIDKAMAMLREAVRLEPFSAVAHFNLGAAFMDRNELEEAFQEFQQAVRLRSTLTEARQNLAGMLYLKGRYCEAAQSYRIALARTEESAALETYRDFIEGCERLARLEPDLPRFLSGELTPSGAEEMMDLAKICHHRRQYLASARFWKAAFELQPASTRPGDDEMREEAACAAFLLGSGRGVDAADLGEEERGRWRRQALDWLREQVKRERALVARGDTSRIPIQQRLSDWKYRPDLDGLQVEEEIGWLPEDERTAWSALWAEASGEPVRGADHGP